MFVEIYDAGYWWIVNINRYSADAVFCMQWLSEQHHYDSFTSF